MKILSSLILLTGLLGTAGAPARAPLKLVQTVPLPGVAGRLDHMSIDVQDNRLYVSALGNNSVEVLDLAAGKVMDQIGGLREPQGVLYVPASGLLFVDNGGDGTCRIFNAATDRPVATVRFPSDADDIRYDRAAGRVYVGYGEGGLGVLNALTGQEEGRIALPAHPEAFEVENGGRRIYVNVPDEREIDLVDWPQRSVTARFPMFRYQANFPMAFDKAHHRLFVATRRPAEFLALDPVTGKILFHLPVVGDADDLYYDAARQRIYVSGGQGFISVIEQTDAGHYRALARIPTAPGARTSLFVPELNRFYLAVPRQGGRAAEIRVYAVQ